MHSIIYKSLVFRRFGFFMASPIKACKNAVLKSGKKSCFWYAFFKKALKSGVRMRNTPQAQSYHLP